MAWTEITRPKYQRGYASDTADPERAVCYDEDHIRSLYRKHHHHVAEVTFGFWCGRKDLLGSQQDIIISVRE